MCNTTDNMAVYLEIGKSGTNLTDLYEHVLLCTNLVKQTFLKNDFRN